MNVSGARLRIERAAPGDATVVRSLARDAAARLGTPTALTTTEDGWRDLLSTDEVTVLVAEVDGRPVGYVSAVRGVHLWSGRDVMSLDDLFVDPVARGVGVGTALMRALADEHPGRPIRWEIEEGNLRAQRFHLRLGARLQRAVTAWWEP